MIFFLKKILRYQQSWVHKQSTQLKQITVNRYITSCEMKDSSNSVSNFTKNFNGSSGLQKLIYVWKELNLPVIGEPKLSHWKLVPTSFCLVLTRTIEKKCWKSATHVFQHFFPIALVRTRQNSAGTRFQCDNPQFLYPGTSVYCTVPYATGSRSTAIPVFHKPAS